MNLLITNPMAAMILLAFLAAATLIDLRRHRVPNALCLALLAIGLTAQFAEAGLSGVTAGLGGLLVGLAVLLPFYAFGGMGAGDVKLMAAVGTFLGVWGALAAAALALMAGGVLALSVIATETTMAMRRGDGFAAALGTVRSVRFPYAAAIGAGTLALFWLSGGITITDGVFA